MTSPLTISATIVLPLSAHDTWAVVSQADRLPGEVTESVTNELLGFRLEESFGWLPVANLAGAIALSGAGGGTRVDLTLTGEVEERQRSFLERRLHGYAEGLLTSFATLSSGLRRAA